MLGTTFQPGGGGEAGLIPIYRTPILVAQPLVTWAAIPQTFQDLYITFNARSTVAATGAGLHMVLNADGAANYDWNQNYFNNGAAVGSACFPAQTSGRIGAITGALAQANDAGSGYCIIPNYKGAILNKSWTGTSFYTDTRVAATLYNQFSGGQWRRNFAITQIILGLIVAGNFGVGSVFSLYGIR